MTIFTFYRFQILDIQPEKIEQSFKPDIILRLMLFLLFCREEAAFREDQAKSWNH